MGGTSGTVAGNEDITMQTLVTSVSADGPKEDRLAVARRRIEAKNTNIAISLADHAERVAKKKARGVNTEVQTAAERLAALRRRVSERRSGGAMAGTADGAAAGVPRRLDEDLSDKRHGSAADCRNGDVLESSDTPASNEDEKMHLNENGIVGTAVTSGGEEVEAGDFGLAATAASGGGGRNNAADGAAAAWAQHALHRGGADDGDRRLSAV